MLDRLGRGQKTGIERSRVLYSLMTSAPLSVMPTIASQVLPCGFLSMIAKIFSRCALCSVEEDIYVL
jgi:hypothetical protein